MAHVLRAGRDRVLIEQARARLALRDENVDANLVDGGEPRRLLGQRPHAQLQVALVADELVPAVVCPARVHQLRRAVRHARVGLDRRAARVVDGRKRSARAVACADTASSTFAAHTIAVIANAAAIAISAIAIVITAAAILVGVVAAEKLERREIRSEVEVDEPVDLREVGAAPHDLYLELHHVAPVRLGVVRERRALLNHEALCPEHLIRQLVPGVAPHSAVVGHVVPHALQPFPQLAKVSLHPVGRAQHLDRMGAAHGQVARLDEQRPLVLEGLRRRDVQRRQRRTDSREVGELGEGGGGDGGDGGGGARAHVSVRFSLVVRACERAAVGHAAQRLDRRVHRAPHAEQSRVRQRVAPKKGVHRALVLLDLEVVPAFILKPLYHCFKPIGDHIVQRGRKPMDTALHVGEVPMELVL
mmetsp:Transcript_4006/g.8557  ORF Transcript_4006/g.8557 Transcript_4006/m.8557 type:complete len:417 (+) Transcript_4006:750-2000(+)